MTRPLRGTSHLRQDLIRLCSGTSVLHGGADRADDAEADVEDALVGLIDQPERGAGAERVVAPRAPADDAF